MINIVPRFRFAAATGSVADGPLNATQDGSVRLLLLADTRIPRRARDLPAQVWDEVASADVVIHAGDWVEVDLLDELGARARRLIACWGNNDGPDLRTRLTERADVTLDGLRFTVVHETGSASGREARMAQNYPETDVLVFGHSHIPWDTTRAWVFGCLIRVRPPTVAANRSAPT